MQFGSCESCGVYFKATQENREEEMLLWWFGLLETRTGIQQLERGRWPLVLGLGDCFQPQAAGGTAGQELLHAEMLLSPWPVSSHLCVSSLIPSQSAGHFLSAPSCSLPESPVLLTSTLTFHLGPFSSWTSSLCPSLF